MPARPIIALLATLLASMPASAKRGDDATCADTPNAEAAIAACTRLFENDGFSARNRAIALGNRGAALRVLGRYEEAIADFTTAIALDPKNPQYYCQRGDLRMRNKAYAEAIADYDAAATRAPKLTWAYHGRGQAHLAQGNAAAAEADFTKALSARPGELNLLVLRGRANTQLGKYEAANADLTKALASPTLKGRLPKERAAVLSLRAFALLKLSRAGDARPDAEEALKLAPKNSFALTVNGLIDEQLGRKADAKISFERALAVDPKSDIAQRGLERVKSGQPETLAESVPTKEAVESKPIESKTVAGTAPVKELCARYFPSVGQTVLVDCER